MEESRACAYCGVQLKRREGEPNREWGARRYCDRACSNRARHDPVEIRFWNFVQKGAPNECWEWKGAKQQKGYGSYLFQGKGSKSSRVAWILTHGPIADGLHVLHNCPGKDNPACCNPAHLYLGTHLRNMLDIGLKGQRQSARGETVGSAKLTEAMVRDARRLYKTGGESIKGLARRFGVSQRAMQFILRGKTWQHVIEDTRGD